MTADHRFQMLMSDHTKNALYRMQELHGGSLSSVLRRGLSLLEAVAFLRAKGGVVCALPEGAPLPEGSTVLKEAE